MVTEGLADTSFFLATETARPTNADAIPDRLAVSVITLGELRAGVLAAGDATTRNQRLSTMGWVLRLDPVPVDDRVAEAWAWLRIQLRDQRRRMPVNDSWIAATAIALGIPVVTQDDAYSVEIPDLEVIRV
jgi:predicted nucleic acid-binding protein